MNEILVVIVAIIVTVILFATPILPFFILYKINASKKKRDAIHIEKFAMFEQLLRKEKFNVSKRITSTECIPSSSSSSFATSPTGLWVDYENEKFLVIGQGVAPGKLLSANKDSILEDCNDSPIFSFNELKSYELGGQESNSAGGMAVGWGPFLVGRGSAKSYIQGFSLRIVIGGATGANAIELRLLPEKVKTTSVCYIAVMEYAKKLTEELDNIMSLQSAGFFNIPSDAEELSKFKKLLDDGVITQAEFDAKKKQLLGL